MVDELCRTIPVTYRFGPCRTGPIKSMRFLPAIRCSFWELVMAAGGGLLISCPVTPAFPPHARTGGRGLESASSWRMPFLGQRTSHEGARSLFIKSVSLK